MQVRHQNKIRSLLSRPWIRWASMLLGVVLCVAGITLSQKGGSVSKSKFESPVVAQPGQEVAALPYSGKEASPSVAALQQQHEARLMAIDGVEGVGTGQDKIGNEALVVYVRDQAVANQVSKVVGGLPVQIIVTGPIEASQSPQ